MTPKELIRFAYAQGFLILAQNGRLIARGPAEKMTPDLREAIARDRVVLCAQAEVMQDEYEERAAMLEYVSHWPRDAAERCARREVYGGES